MPRTSITEQLRHSIATAYSAAFTDTKAARRKRISDSLTIAGKDAAALAALAEKAEALCTRLAALYNQKIPGSLTNTTAVHTNGTQEITQQQTELIRQLDSIDETITKSFAKEFISALFFDDDPDEEPQNDSGILQSIAATQKIYKKIRLLALQMHGVFTKEGAV